MEKIDFKKCETCTEKRCVLAFLQKDLEQIKKEKEEAKLLKKFKEIRKKKLIDYYIKETEFYETMKQRELKLIDYDRKPYMNESDWRHDNNWFLCIQAQMDLQEKHFKALEELYSFTIEDLI